MAKAEWKLPTSSGKKKQFYVCPTCTKEISAQNWMRHYDKHKNV